jgi:ssRNA-specific RNase YbeY (16S rRNA maturation enzyme)
MLHLQGYEHDTVRAARAMEARETAILKRLGMTDPYVETCVRTASVRG